MIFFTADSHFGHDKIRSYCKRPFQTVEEMDETLIKNWNSVVTSWDTVYHLGDFAFGNAEKIKSYLNRLRGNKIFILGNHDKNLHKVRQVKEVLEISILDKTIFLSHYAHRTWSKSFHGSWHLFGHSHGTLPDYGLSFDVGVDCWNFTPVSLDQVSEKMKNLKCIGV